MDSRSENLKVLCTPAGGGTLPRIYVNICSVGRPTRVVAAVDTCSSRNLISQQLVASLGAPVSPTTDTILAINETPLDVCGMVELTVKQTDGLVILPKTSSKFIVVADLSTVRTDVVLGEELIAAVGGINLPYDKGCLSSVTFGQNPDLLTRVTAAAADDHSMRHTKVEYDGDDVILQMSDVSVRWKAISQQWKVMWRWNDDSGPPGEVGSGIGEYSRQKLSAVEEECFHREIRT